MASKPFGFSTSERTLLRSDFCLHKNQSHAPSFLLFRKKAHSRRLFACKRAHNAFGSLPPFCECAPLAHSVSKPFGFPMLQRRRCASFAQNACRRTEFINLNHAHFLHLLIFFNEHVIIITATQLLKGAIWLFGKSRAK